MDYRNPQGGKYHRDNPPRGGRPGVRPEQRPHGRPEPRPHSSQKSGRSGQKGKGGAGTPMPYEYYSKKSRENARAKQTSSHADMKGTMSADEFNKSITDDENLYLAEEADRKQSLDKAVNVRKIIVTLLFTIAALGLNILTFPLPYAPTILKVDLSPLPELIVCLAVHPIAAVAMIVVKNGMYLLASPASWSNVPGKIILEVLFVIMVWMLFQRLIVSPRFKDNNDVREMAGVPLKDYSIPVTIISGAVSSAVTSFVSLFTTRFIAIPLLNKKNHTEDALNIVFSYYQSAYTRLTNRFEVVGNFLPGLDNMLVGLVVYNIPVSFFKYFFCTLLAAIIFPFIRDFVERPKKNK